MEEHLFLLMEEHLFFFINGGTSIFLLMEEHLFLLMEIKIDVPPLIKTVLVV
jgi:hypothetical protein